MARIGLALTLLLAAWTAPDADAGGRFPRAPVRPAVSGFAAEPGHGLARAGTGLELLREIESRAPGRSSGWGAPGGPAAAARHSTLRPHTAAARAPLRASPAPRGHTPLPYFPTGPPARR